MITNYHNQWRLSKANAQLENINDKLEEANARLEQYSCTLETKVTERTQELKNTLHELKNTQTHLIQSEKMAALGQMVAGIAHEINNSTNFIYGNVNPANDYASDLLKLIELYQAFYPETEPEIEEFIENIDLDYLREDFPKLLKSMKTGASRIQGIVKSLRIFSRLDEAEVKKVDIHEGIDSTLMILKNRLKQQGEYPEIKVIKEYAKLPLVNCYAGQLNQVFMNLLSNAIDALEERQLKLNLEELETNPNYLKIVTQVKDNSHIVISIVDNALGIPESIQNLLFDPFFTTKPVGKGTGLGLSISHAIIVEKHGGKLQCYSNPGQGTEFRIEIPNITQN
ncbi:MAG: GHKL domain-containing protein [Moorea sp. SIO2B7]|nr:GHKL domain-containing protein [Moorena sp. SIO2B7]